MFPCECKIKHARRRIVLTGGPGAGKTAVLELVRQYVCQHVVVLPEAAGIVFGGGFPRRHDEPARRAAQRAIYYVQRELERHCEADNVAGLLCDRGTIDGAAYWPGDEERYFEELGTSQEAELARYDTVLHLRTPGAHDYDYKNPLRVETPTDARIIDTRIARAWQHHPNRVFIEPRASFLEKAEIALALLRATLPGCCRGGLMGNGTN